MAGETLERLQQRIGSLGDLRMIVRTMKALSAARIRQHEEAVAAIAGYARTIQLGLHVVLRELPSLPPPLPATARGAVRGLVVFGSDHGLCGRFNEEVAAFAATLLPPPGEPAPLVAAVGSRAADNLRANGVAVTEELAIPASPAQITAMVTALLPTLERWQDGGLHHLVLCYNRHEGPETYRSTSTNLLPLDLAELRQLEEQRWPSRHLPTFTMDRQTLLSRLLHQHLFVSLFRASAESQASEHAARLAAMHQAQRNIDEHLETLTGDFRRTRQDAITAELLDVVGGFEAVSAEADPG